MDHPYRDLPILPSREFSREGTRAVPIEDCGEPLVSASLVPERMLARPQYYFQMLEGAVPEIFVRRSVLARLLGASSFLPPGCRLILLDGWRSRTLQTALFQRFRSELRKKMPLLDDQEIVALVSHFVAPPSLGAESPSPHFTGGSVDVTVADESGICLNMGAEFDETTERSGTRFYEARLELRERMSTADMEALHNRRLLHAVMSRAGFTNYPGEWWHFDYGNQNWAFLKGQETALYGASSPSFRWGSLS